MKKVYIYGTGHEIPAGAVYLCTKTETRSVTRSENSGVNDGETTMMENVLVWHYFLVEVKKK